MRAERKGGRLVSAVFVTTPLGDRGPASSPAILSLLIHYSRSRKSDAGPGAACHRQTGQPPLLFVASLSIAEEKILVQTQARHMVLPVLLLAHCWLQVIFAAHAILGLGSRQDLGPQCGTGSQVHGQENMKCQPCLSSPGSLRGGDNPSWGSRALPTGIPV